MSTRCSSTRGPGQAAVLGDVADQHRGHRAVLGRADQPVGALAHLGDRAGRRRQLAGRTRSGWSRRHHVGLHRVDVLEQRRQRRLGHQPQVGRQRAEPLGPQAHLLGRLLGGDVEAAAAVLGQPGQRLQEQRGLADAGLAAEQGDRAGHQAALEHPVELAEVGGRRRPRRHVDLGDRQRHARGVARSPAEAASRPRRGSLDLLDEGVPRLAGGAAARPLGFRSPTFVQR